MASSSASLYRVFLGILLNACFMLTLRAASVASLPAISFPYVPAWALTQENFILHLVFSSNLPFSLSPPRGMSCEWGQGRLYCQCI
jgi:hypothetical protein